MSWYRDPQLFICVYGLQGNYPKHFYTKRFTQTFGVSTLGVRDLDNPKLVDFSEDLNLGYNKFSDYDYLKDYIVEGDAAANTQKYINCQGLTLTLNKKTYQVIWGHETPDSPFYNLVPVPLSENELVAMLSACRDDRDRENADKHVLLDRVTYLETAISDLDDQVRSGNEAKKAAISERDKEKAHKEVLQERVTNFEDTVSELKDQVRSGNDATKEAAINERDKEKVEKQEKVTNLETKKKNARRKANLKAKIAILEDEARRGNDIENTALVSDLKKTIVLVEDHLLREKLANNDLKKDNDREISEKQAVMERFSGLQEEITNLTDELNRVKEEKHLIAERLVLYEPQVVQLTDRILELIEHLEDWKYEVSDAQDQLDREKKANHALRQQVAGMKSLLELCSCGVGKSTEKETWMSVYPVPSNWVPFGDLRVQGFSRNGKPLTITKTTSEPAFSEDNTTNIQVSYLYRAMLNKCVFQIVAVNVEELVPNREKARFDPSIWSLFNNAGICYAARKPFESEMSIHTRKKS